MTLSNLVKHVVQIVGNGLHSPTELPKEDFKTDKEAEELFLCAPSQSCKPQLGPPKLELPQLYMALQRNFGPFLGNEIFANFS